MADRQTSRANRTIDDREQPTNNDNKVPPKKKKKSGLFSFLFPILLVVSIIFGLWAYFIKANKFGLGERFRGSLKNIPVVRMVLPPNPDPEAAEYMSEDQLAEKYEEFRAKVKELGKQVEEQQKTIGELQKYKDNEQKMVNETSQQKASNEQEKKKIEEERKKLEQEKLKFAEQIKQQDEKGFTEYFENMDKDIAAQIYEKIMREKQVDEEVANFVKTFENMEPANAADILENMGFGNIDLVSNIMKLMKRQAAAEIMGNMDPVFAANLADRMAVEYPIYPEE